MLRNVFASALLLALAACTPPAADAPSAPTQEIRADDTLARVASPEAGARVTSPLAITGIAPANWYFENQFPVRLLDAQGNEIAAAPATPRVSWTENTEPKEFDATLTFSVTSDTPAVLVLQQDMVPEGETPLEVRVDVVLTAN